MVLKTMLLRATSKRIPLIKFRKGGPVMSAAGSDTASKPLQQAGAPTASGSSMVSSKEKSNEESEMKSTKYAATQRGPAIEDWQLPPRYRRKPLDPIEMDYINRGGPA